MQFLPTAALQVAFQTTAIWKKHTERCTNHCSATGCKTLPYESRPRTGVRPGRRAGAQRDPLRLGLRRGLLPFLFDSEESLLVRMEWPWIEHAGGSEDFPRVFQKCENVILRHKTTRNQASKMFRKHLLEPDPEQSTT